MFKVGNIVKFADEETFISSVRGIIAKVIGVKDGFICVEHRSGNSLPSSTIERFSLPNEAHKWHGWTTSQLHLIRLANSKEEMAYMNRSHHDECPCKYCEEGNE